MDQLHDINLIYHFCSWSSSNCWNECTLRNISLLRFLLLHVRQSKIVTQTVNSLSDSSTTSCVVKISSHMWKRKRISSPKKLSEALNDFFYPKLSWHAWIGREKFGLGCESIQGVDCLFQLNFWICTTCLSPIFQLQCAYYAMHCTQCIAYFTWYTIPCILSTAY